MAWDAEDTPPIKPDIHRRRCSLIPIHKTVRITRFSAEMQALLYEDIRCRQVSWSEIILYNIMVYIMHDSGASQFNNLPILVTMVTQKVPPNLFPWQPKSRDMWTVSLLTWIPNMMKIGLNLAKVVRNCIIAQYFQ